MFLYFLQVLSDMTLILLSVVGNLFVLNSLREKEALLAITQNLVSPIFFSTLFWAGSFCPIFVVAVFFLVQSKHLRGCSTLVSSLESLFLQVLLNICFANLVSAIFIKSISIIHNGFQQHLIQLRHFHQMQYYW